METKILRLPALLVFSLVLGMGFASAGLVYFAHPNEEVCQTISVDYLTKPVSVGDVWAENEESDWPDFKFSSQEHDLTLSYPEHLTDEDEIDVCITGKTVGEFRGAIVFREDSSDESVDQVLLEVIVEGKADPVSSNLGKNNDASVRNTGNVGLTIEANNSTGSDNNSLADYELLAADVDSGAKEAENLEKGEKNAFEKLDLFSPFRLIPILVIIGLVISSILVKKKRERMRPPSMQKFY